MLNKSYKQVMEDVGASMGAPVNNAGSGNIAGIGVGVNGEPPRRRDKFAGHEVFEVDSSVFSRCRTGKYRYHRWSSYVGDDETGQEIKEYGLNNPKTPIIVKDKQSGTMMFLRYDKRHDFGGNR